MMAYKDANVRARCYWILKKGTPESIIKLIWGGFSRYPAPMPQIVLPARRLAENGVRSYTVCTIRFGPAQEIYP